jgi:phage-related protein
VKDVVFVGSAGEDLRRFPTAARQRAGYQLYLVQTGVDPTDWKPMPSVGTGCRELRIRADREAFRVVYVATIGDAVYVLHAFQKKTQRTAKTDIDLAKQRYKQAVDIVQTKGRP